MPQFLFSTAMTANQAGLNPLAGWQYEYLPWPAQVLLLVRSTTTGTRVTIYSGSETIRERTPLQAGGTAGVTPSELNTPADAWLAAGGDRLKLVIDEVAGGTPTVDGIIIANPMGELMARFNEILVGRYNRYLQKLLGIKGPPPSAQRSPEVGSQI